MIFITAHAVERFIERVDPSLNAIQAEAAIRLSERAVECAADFHCGTVRLGNGAALICKGRTVVTVIGKWRDRKLAPGMVG